MKKVMFASDMKLVELNDSCCLMNFLKKYICVQNRVYLGDR